MTSDIDRLHQSLVPRGHYYTVLKGFAGLRAGERVRILQTYYGSNKEDSGFIVVFPDRESIRLHSVRDSEVIEKISQYLRKGEAFDEAAAIAEFNARMKQENELWERTEKERMSAERAAVHEEAQKSGISPKEAFLRLKRSKYSRK